MEPSLSIIDLIWVFNDRHFNCSGHCGDASCGFVDFGNGSWGSSCRIAEKAGTFRDKLSKFPTTCTNIYVNTGGKNNILLPAGLSKFLRTWS